MAQRRSGFSLLELLLALSFGLTLLGIIGKAILGDATYSMRLVRMLRERTLTERALALIRMELQESPAVEVMPGAMVRDGCGLKGRTVMLHLDFIPVGVVTDQDVTYSIDRKPDPIWRGQTLVRCGPSYGLDGQMEHSAAVSRIWLDALHSDGFVISRDESSQIRLTVLREFQQLRREPYQDKLTIVIPVPGLL